LPNDEDSIYLKIIYFLNNINKFSNGEYFVKKKTDKDWISTKNNESTKKSVENYFSQLGFKKDDKGLFYVK
jgi:hypothetical protein